MKIIAKNPPKALSRPPVEPLWKTDETARFLGLSTMTLARYRETSKGPKAYLVGRYYRYKPSEVLAWLEAQAVRSSGPVAASAGQGLIGAVTP